MSSRGLVYSHGFRVTGPAPFALTLGGLSPSSSAHHRSPPIRFPFADSSLVAAGQFQTIHSKRGFGSEVQPRHTHHVSGETGGEEGGGGGREREEMKAVKPLVDQSTDWVKAIGGKSLSAETRLLDRQDELRRICPLERNWRGHPTNCLPDDTFLRISLLLYVSYEETRGVPSRSLSVSTYYVQLSSSPAKSPPS